MATSAPRTAVQGLVSGALATVPMSMVMLAAGRAGAMGDQPTERMTDKVFGAAGMIAAHVVYGGVLGAVEARVARGEKCFSS
jgi:hypothetical protein